MAAAQLAGEEAAAGGRLGEARRWAEAALGCLCGAMEGGVAEAGAALRLAKSLISAETVGPGARAARWEGVPEVVLGLLQPQGAAAAGGRGRAVAGPAVAVLEVLARRGGQAAVVLGALAPAAVLLPLARSSGSRCSEERPGHAGAAARDVGPATRARAALTLALLGQLPDPPPSARLATGLARCLAGSQAGAGGAAGRARAAQALACMAQAGGYGRAAVLGSGALDAAVGALQGCGAVDREVGAALAEVVRVVLMPDSSAIPHLGVVGGAGRLRGAQKSSAGAPEAMARPEDPGQAGPGALGLAGPGARAREQGESIVDDGTGDGDAAAPGPAAQDAGARVMQRAARCSAARHRLSRLRQDALPSGLRLLAAARSLGARGATDEEEEATEDGLLGEEGTGAGEAAAQAAVEAGVGASLRRAVLLAPGEAPTFWSRGGGRGRRLTARAGRGRQDRGCGSSGSARVARRRRRLRRWQRRGWGEWSAGRAPRSYDWSSGRCPRTT